MYLHSELTPNADATRLNDTSFIVTWNPSRSNYSYLVAWNDDLLGKGNNTVVPGNTTNSHIVTGLNDNTSYTVNVTAMGECGNKTSRPVTVSCECI